MRRYPLPTTTLGLLLAATATTALPVDVGRTADVHTNAARYFEARAAQPSNWPSPQERPTNLVAAAEPVEDVAPEQDTLITADAGDAVLGEPNAVSSAVDTIVAQSDVVPAEPTVTAAALSVEAETQALAVETQMSGDLKRAIDVAIADQKAIAVTTNKPDPFAIALEEGLAQAFDDARDAELIAAIDVPAPIAEDEDVAVEDDLVRVAQATEPDAAASNEAPIAIAMIVDEGLRQAVEAKTAAVAVAVAEAEAVTVVVADAVAVVDADADAAAADADAAAADDVTLDAFGGDDVTLAAAPFTDQLQPSVGSSRQAADPDADLVEVVAGVVDEAALEAEAEDDGDLMADMADADENLIVRDGGEDGIDTIMMSSDVLFDFGSATLAGDALATLSSIGDMSEDVPVLEVFGHTDAIGSEANNLRLGQERAEAVREWLLQNTTFTEDQVIATGIGEVDPIAPNLLDNGDDNPDGRAQNRRVEFAFHEAGHVPE